MAELKNGLNDKQIKQFIEISKKVKDILERLAWRHVEELEIHCNHIRVDIINMSNISIFFINKSVMGDKNIAKINIPYEALTDSVGWFQKQLEQSKKFQQDVAEKIEKRKRIQKQAKEQSTN